MNSEWRANVVDNCGHCGAVLTLDSQNWHQCAEGAAAMRASVEKSFEEYRASKTMKDEQSAKQSAVEKVVEYLFTSGDGSKADRLVLWRDGDKRDLGGWSRKPIADKLAEIYDAGVLASRAERPADVREAVDKVNEYLRNHPVMDTEGYQMEIEVAKLWVTGAFLDGLAAASAEQQPWVAVEDGLPQFADKKWITIEAPWYARPNTSNGRYDGTGWQILTLDGYEAVHPEARVTAWKDIEETPAPFTPQEAPR